MRQYTSTIIFALLAVTVPAIGAATQWPWPWWAWGTIAVFFVLGAIFAFPVRPHPAPENLQTAFIKGDATGSTFRNIYSEADHIVHGDARHAFFWNIIHRPQRGQR